MFLLFVYIGGISSGVILSRGDFVLDSGYRGPNICCRKCTFIIVSFLLRCVHKMRTPAERCALAYTCRGIRSDISMYSNASNELGLERRKSEYLMQRPVVDG